MSEPTEHELDEIRCDIFIKRVRDLRGWLLESFTEAEDGGLSELANTIVAMTDCKDDCVQLTFAVAHIGESAYRLIYNRCIPSNEEVYDEWSRSR